MISASVRDREEVIVLLTGRPAVGAGIGRDGLTVGVGQFPVSVIHAGVEATGATRRADDLRGRVRPVVGACSGVAPLLAN